MAYNKKVWIKELKSWIRGSKQHAKFCETQLAFWQRLHKKAIEQIKKEEQWLKEAEADK